MKTKGTWIGLAIVACLGMGRANAQAAAGSSKEVHPTTNTAVAQAVEADTAEAETSYRSERGIPTPPAIEKMLSEGNISQALAEFEKFKKTQRKANPYDLLYLEMTVYRQAQMGDPRNAAQYEKKIEEITQTLIAKYPDVSDTYLLQIDEKTAPEKIIELATKAIEVDPENLPAYDTRARALFQIGQIKEACADLEKLPYKNQLPEYWSCR